jgi:hypothetical protein
MVKIKRQGLDLGSLLKAQFFGTLILDRATLHRAPIPYLFYFS